MRKFLSACFFILSICIATHSYALLNLELTKGVSGAIPIAIVPFGVIGSPSQNISEIINNDLQMSGRFKVYGGNRLASQPNRLADVKFDYFKNLGVDNIVIGRVEEVGGGQYKVSFQLLDTYRGKEQPVHSILIDKNFTVANSSLRPLAHHISDLIYQQITGVRGIFSTRLAYIVVQKAANGSERDILEVSDVDGYNPRALLTSYNPIMSPAWSPNGQKIAYVSFEKKHSAIYLHDVATGSRELVSEFEGINGAPAWSPDGRRLALVLSKDGAPNIYIMDLASRRLSKVTNDLSINTEPAWSPNGKSILFTSNRGGSPQIYQKNLSTGAITRITYDGNYNARASFTHDGNHIVVLNKESNLYNIGILDLNTGSFKILTNNSGTDNESPSIAPNGSMVLYGTLYNGRNVLGLVATDGSVQLRMPARTGEVQDPCWSPFLS